MVIHSHQTLRNYFEFVIADTAEAVDNFAEEFADNPVTVDIHYFDYSVVAVVHF